MPTAEAVKEKKARDAARRQMIEEVLTEHNASIGEPPPSPPKPAKMPSNGRKRRNERSSLGVRLSRINVEVYPEEEAIVRQGKAQAAVQGVMFRQWLMDAIREKVERA